MANVEESFYNNSDDASLIAANSPQIAKDFE